MERLLKEAAQLVKATPAESCREDHTSSGREQVSEGEKLRVLKSKAGSETQLGDVMDQVKEVKGVKLLAAQLRRC